MYANPSAWKTLAEDLCTMADKAEFRKQPKMHFFTSKTFDFVFCFFITTVKHPSSYCNRHTTKLHMIDVM